MEKKAWIWGAILFGGGGILMAVFVVFGLSFFLGVKLALPAGLIPPAVPVTPTAVRVGMPPARAPEVTPTAMATLLPSATATETPAPAIPASTPTVDLNATATPEFISTPTPASLESVKSYESQVTVQAYDWENALVPTGADDAIYPYSRLNFEAVGGPAPRAVKVWVLENECVRVSVMPSLGGRIYSWEDLRSGRRLTYANPVWKPTHWGYRGWWLATGGVEWAFPVEEHGLNEARPWQSEWVAGEGRRGIRVWDTESQTGVTVEVTMWLAAGRCDLTVQPRIVNGTGKAQSFQFWSNMMLDLSGHGPTSALHFWMPTAEVILHSTGDESLPGPGTRVSWPVIGERDFSQYGNWQRYLGFFAAEARGAVGIYDASVEQGVVRVYPARQARGVKFFGLGDLSADLYTDGASRYVEMWGGYTQTFGDYASLSAGGEVSWEEHWYPVRDLGRLRWADGQLAVGVREEDGGLRLAVDAPGAVQAHLVLRQGEGVAGEWDVTGPFQVVVPGVGGNWTLEVQRRGLAPVEIKP